MRIAIGAICQVTNAFSRVPTTLLDFESSDYRQGEVLVQAHRGRATVLGGVIAAAERHGIEVVPTVAAQALAGGPVDSTAFDALCDRLCGMLQRDSVDGFVLHLSGAMETSHTRHADAAVLRRVRETLGPAVPIGVMVDFQANLTGDLAKDAAVVMAPRTYPTGDGAERGARMLELVTAVIQGAARPAIAVEATGVLLPIPAQGSDRSPMRNLLALAREIESEPGVLDVSVTGGFPYTAAPSGIGVVVTTDGVPTRARSLATRIHQAAIAGRGDVPRVEENIETAIHRAMASPQGTFVLADTGDDPGAGAPGDGTGLLWGLLDLGARDAALAAIADPVAVKAAIAAGVGAWAQIRVGARTDRRHGYPIDVDARVVRIADGRIRRAGPLDPGAPLDLGRTVLLRARGRHDGEVDVILTERRVEADDPAIFRALGVEPAEKRIIVVKSSARFRPAFEPLADEIIEVTTPGITTPEFAFFDSEALRQAQ